MSIRVWLAMPFLTGSVIHAAVYMGYKMAAEYVLGEEYR